MIKALTIGLGIALSFGVASAQPKKAPARKKPAAGAKKSDPKTDPAPAATQPDAPADAASSAGDLKRPAGAAQPSKTDAAPRPDGSAPTGAGAPAKPGGPMKTDEKAGTNEKLDKRGTGDYRDVSAANERAASVAFQQANDQLNDGFFVKAADKYREALSHWDHPAIHYNLALALINLDQPIEVYEQLNKALQYGADPLEKDKFDHAKEYLKLVEGQLADVEVSCSKPGTKVSVDGKEVFVAPGKYTSKVRVGKHTFYGDKQGYNARVETPFVGPGEKFRIELKLYTGEELTRYRRKWDRTWVPYTMIGAGAVVGIVGGILELSASSSFKDYDAAVAKCNDPITNAGCDPNMAGLQDMRSSGNSKRTAGFVMYGIAGGAIATGAVLAWINRREPYRISPEDFAEERISVTPVVAPGMAGALVQGHF